MPKVGLNSFQIPEEEDTLLKEIVEGKIELWSEESTWSRNIKKGGDAGKIKDMLSGSPREAKDAEQNLMAAIMEAFEAGATMGEIGGRDATGLRLPVRPPRAIESPI